MTWKKITENRPYYPTRPYYPYEDSEFYPPEKIHKDWVPTNGGWVHRNGGWVITGYEPNEWESRLVYQIARIPFKNRKAIAESIKQHKPSDHSDYINIDGYYQNDWISEAIQKEYPNKFKSFEQARLHTTLKTRKERVQKTHNYRKHSAFCSPETCEAVKQSHSTNHKLCNIFNNCEEIEELHGLNNHSSCSGYWCDVNKKIKQYHANGEHSKYYCTPANCPDVKLSHATDHKLCDQGYFNQCVEVIQNHKDEFHTLCKPDGHCRVKFKIEKQHGIGEHSEQFCTPKSCPEIALNHSSGHHELCTSFCQNRTVAWAHSKDKHFDGICDIISCPKMNYYHNSGNHSICKSIPHSRCHWVNRLNQWFQLINE